jgi:hypothetical protein
MNSIKMYFREMMLDVVGCVYLSEDRGKWRAVVDTLMKLRVP